MAVSIKHREVGPVKSSSSDRHDGSSTRLRQLSNRWTTRAAVVFIVAVASVFLGPVNDASATPPVPNGLAAIIATFGTACNANAHGYTYYNVPYASWTDPNAPGNWTMHTSLSGVVSGQLAQIGAFNPEALSYGSGMYNCRHIKRADGTESPNWSVHAWGVAIDTNTAANPQGQPYWYGYGHNGQWYGFYIPNMWTTGPAQFYWGAYFSNIDVMHFQWATGY
jgi:D-alanyl-D-alanine carboxypeptidase